MELEGHEKPYGLLNKEDTEKFEKGICPECGGKLSYLTCTKCGSIYVIMRVPEGKRYGEE
jgi:ribosomal protein L40E